MYIKPVRTLAMLVFFTICSTIVRSQDLRKVIGTVQDSSGHAIRSASVLLSSAHDTIRTITDSLGKFSFSNVSTDKFKITVSSIGYRSYIGIYAFKEKEEQLTLKPLILESNTQMLQEVTIKGKIEPVKVKKDTIEYNAAAYRVLPDDRVSELIKQLPGVMLDANGNVTSMGKTLTKIRVNGKDFFTGNVKEFIQQLPADLVSKIQIINDYGDQAAYTGVKTGEPTKMLNLITKKGQNQGKFGNMSVNLGTNRAYGLREQANLWQDTRQISFNAGISRADNGAGKSTRQEAALNYQDSLRGNNTVTVQYAFGRNTGDSREQNYTETVTEGGSIFTNNINTASENSLRHQLSLRLQHKGKKDFINTGLTGSVTTNSNKSLSRSDQSGLIVQGQTTGNKKKSNSPNIQAFLQFSRNFSKPGRSVSINVNGGSSPVSVDNYQDNLIRYFNPVTNVLQKDSLLNLLINSQNRVNEVNTLINYNEPIGKATEGVNRSVNLSYVNKVSGVRNSLISNAKDAAGSYNVVDSLSNSYKTFFMRQQLSLSYIYTGKSLDYTFGVSALPSYLKGSYIGRLEQVRTSDLSILPVLNINYHPAEGQSVTLVYTGNSILPNFNQLQPLPDTRNLQNVVIGNPDLKPSVVHSGTLSYNRNAESGSLFQLSAIATTIQNNIVSNTIIIPDTLNSLKQQTRYLNTSGNYSCTGSYSWSVPFANNHSSIEMLGNIGYSKDTYYADNRPGTTKGLNYTQGLNFRASNKWMRLNTGANYSFSANRYSLSTLNPGDLRTWTFTSDARFVIQKNFRTGFQVNKMINEGYAFSQANPLIVNLDAELLLFKRHQGSIKIQAFDLLNQGENQQRTVSGNTVTDSRTSQLRRYFQATFAYRLEKFGKGRKPMQNK